MRGRGEAEDPRSPGLTQPHVLQVDDEAPGEVEDGEEGVAHEGGGLKGGQRRGHEQCHAAAAVHHEPHQQQAEQEACGGGVEPGQPVDGETVDQSEGTVLRELAQYLEGGRTIEVKTRDTGSMRTIQRQNEMKVNNKCINTKIIPFQ